MMNTLTLVLLACAINTQFPESRTQLKFCFEDGEWNKQEVHPLLDFCAWEGDREWFRLEDNAIVAGSLEKSIPVNHFLCTKADFEDFDLTLEVKLEGEGANAGIQFRTKRIPNDTEVSGYQADMGEGYWGCLYDESRRNKVLAKPDEETLKKALKPNDWNTYRIRAEGPHIQLWLNGVQTVDYVEKDDGIARRGIIGLQIHAGKPSIARYRNILLHPLSK